MSAHLVRFWETELCQSFSAFCTLLLHKEFPITLNGLIYIHNKYLILVFIKLNGDHNLKLTNQMLNFLLTMNTIISL